MTILSRAVLGALAGAVLGALEQLLTNFPSDVSGAALVEVLPRLGEGAAIGGPAWAVFAVVLGMTSDWSVRAGTQPIRLFRWTLGVVLFTGFATTALWLAGRFGRGFSRDFALFHALAFVAPGAAGVWLGWLVSHFTTRIDRR